MSSLAIACSLSAADLAAARDRYRAAAYHYRAEAQITGTAAQIALTGDKAALHDLLTDMIERESGCCSFLSFDIDETPNGYDVHLRVTDASGLEPELLRDTIGTLFPSAAQVTTTPQTS